MNEGVILAEETEGTGVPRIPYDTWLEDGFNWLTGTFSAVVDGADAALSTVSGSLADLLAGPDALVLALIFVLVGWLLRDWKMALLTAPLMFFIISADQWENTMETLALVAVAAVVALIIGIPLGVLAAKNSVVSNAVRPVMDLMQTMPALVWLIPAMAMFGLGMAAGIFATVIFALPPGVRLTELAIRQVDQEVVEAGHAFGSTPWQILMRIQLPLATKTIMAGVNQVIMLALSMAVFGGFVGAGGLGNEVSRAINTLDLGLGLEAGLCVVMLAIYLDRVTASIGSGGSLAGRLLRTKGMGFRKAAGPASV
ncbi:ABC transporter permease [Nesterenkonia lacusekhoensis]|uniref:ABC-type proline/glycine betaine transport system permease subunit n=1 Tax=Nesterenkonia lacusekhoensis TaxID=150832 RepID=A0ABS4SYP1_9MICC|nr:ABC transporter permease subunit [Nesterenkonia lacusekhoensis]MBP2317313.1 ABC-type proline/glycine betaine transport system permease subunit [Nesterenkonia lacusekhoensis]